MSDIGPSGIAPQPPAAALMVAMQLVTRYRMRLTHPSDSRLGDLAQDYVLGAAIWTGERAAFVGFYQPPADATAAGHDLAARCARARAWGEQRLGVQDARTCQILLIPLAPVGGGITQPPAQGAVSLGVVALDVASATATELLPSPRGLPAARELKSLVQAVHDGAPVPSLAAVDLAERTAVREGTVGPARNALQSGGRIGRYRLHPMLMTYSLIGLWVGIWLIEHLVTQASPNLQGYGGINSPSTSLIASDAFGALRPSHNEWWRYMASGFVHDFNDPLHVGLNSLAMYILGRLVEPLYGKLVLLGTFLIAVIGGNLLVIGLTATGAFPPSFSLGASGGICGFIGLILVLGRVQGRNMPVNLAHGLRTSMMINIVFIMVYSFAIPGIAWPAHLGGFVVGAVAGLILPPVRGVGGRDLTGIERYVIYALIAFTVICLIAMAVNVASVVASGDTTLPLVLSTPVP